jgi:hypothetical protein
MASDLGFLADPAILVASRPAACLLDVCSFAVILVMHRGIDDQFAGAL